MIICVRCGWVQEPTPRETVLVVHECPLCPSHTQEYIDLNLIDAGRPPTEAPDAFDLVDLDELAHG